VVGRHVFYNNSKRDGHPGFAKGDPAANEFDDGAIASDKEAILPGQTGTFANYTSYPRGINGIMVDIQGLADPIAVADGDLSEFDFRYGNDDTPDDWLPAPTPLEVTVRDIGGGVHRITFVWADKAIPNKNWVQVTVKEHPNTGLAADDVFYFGNTVGENTGGPGSITQLLHFARLPHCPTFFQRMPCRRFGHGLESESIIRPSVRHFAMQALLPPGELPIIPIAARDPDLLISAPGVEGLEDERDHKKRPARTRFGRPCGCRHELDGGDSGDRVAACRGAFAVERESGPLVQRSGLEGRARAEKPPGRVANSGVSRSTIPNDSVIGPPAMAR
jgi:hypothetical protein